MRGGTEHSLAVIISLQNRLVVFSQGGLEVLKKTVVQLLICSSGMIQAQGC